MTVIHVITMITDEVRIIKNCNKSEVRGHHCWHSQTCIYNSGSSTVIILFSQFRYFDRQQQQHNYHTTIHLPRSSPEVQLLCSLTHTMKMYIISHTMQLHVLDDWA